MTRKELIAKITALDEMADAMKDRYTNSKISAGNMSIWYLDDLHLKYARLAVIQLGAYVRIQKYADRLIKEYSEQI